MLSRTRECHISRPVKVALTSTNRLDGQLARDSLYYEGRDTEVGVVMEIE